MKWVLSSLSNPTTTSTSYVETNSRDLAANIFLPRDCTVTFELTGDWWNSGAGNLNGIEFTIDGAATNPIADTFYLGTSNQPIVYKQTQRLAAGKHRVALLWKATAGTATLE